MDLYGFIASFQILTENVLLNFDEWSPAWLQCISTSGNKDQLNGDPLACWLLWRYWQGTLLHRRISRAMWVCDWVAKQNEHRIPKKKDVDPPSAWFSFLWIFFVRAQSWRRDRKSVDCSLGYGTNGHDRAVAGRRDGWPPRAWRCQDYRWKDAVALNPWILMGVNLYNQFCHFLICSTLIHPHLVDSFVSPLIALSICSYSHLKQK